MRHIQRLRKKIIPPGSRLEAIVRSIYRKLSHAQHEGRSSDFQHNKSGLESLTKPEPRASANYKDHLGEIQLFKVDEVDTSLIDAGSELPVPVASLANDQGKLADRLRKGMDARAIYDQERHALRQQGQELFAGKSLLFVLPIAAAGGGANLILLAARTMRQMNVDAQIYNLSPYRSGFEQAYPDNDVPMVYGAIENLPKIATHYDAVVATSYITVYWLKSVPSLKPDLVLGYYIQDYEPYFDEPGSEGYKKAAASYTLFPRLVRCCTTPWIDAEIQHQHSGDNRYIPVTVLGASLDVDLFMPRPRHDSEWPHRSLRVAAMIRPSTPRRSPILTMELMERASQEFGDDIEFILFGADLVELQQAHMPVSFPFKLAGRLNQKQVAMLMNEVDIFVDYSTFQGLGLTALEAMACGAATVIPARGGTDVYAKHEKNCLMVDTQDREACFAALNRLIKDHELRVKLQQNGMLFTPRFYPELPTIRLLQALWSQNPGAQL
jgi:glycosyltransferase involved in cell wall biosynthesis